MGAYAHYFMLNDKKCITNLMTSIFRVMGGMSVSCNDERWENGVDLVEGLEEAWKVLRSHIAETDD